MRSMEGLGEGYEAFLERLQSDFAISKGSAQNGNPSLHGLTSNSSSNKGGANLNRSTFSAHPPPSNLPHPKYVGYPSPANAFTVKKDESSPSLESSIRGGLPRGDMARGMANEEKSPSMGFPSILRTVSSDLTEISNLPYHHRGHRRAQSETFRLPDDIEFDYEPLETSAEADELGEDFFSMLDLEKMNISSATTSMLASKNASSVNHMPTSHHARSFSVDQVLAGFNSMEDTFGNNEEPFLDGPKHKHSHSYSMDGSMPFPNKETLSSSSNSKAEAAKKLAELTLIDPKRAKRILANRQSAARSKERKMRYIAELEGKVQALQAEATTISAQLSMVQNDTIVLTTENNELKFQLQGLEQQTRFSNALNLALREEVQRLKVATREFGKNGQLSSCDDHPLLSSKPFYHSQPPSNAGSIRAGQQLQQLQSVLKQQQVGKHQGILK